MALPVLETWGGGKGAALYICILTSAYDRLVASIGQYLGPSKL